MPCRFVLSIRKVGTDEEIFKVRFVLGGRRDREKRIIVQNSNTEKRLMIEIAEARQAYNGKETDSIAILESKYNTSDAKTKIKPKDALNNLLTTYKLSHPIRKYIIDY